MCRRGIAHAAEEHYTARRQKEEDASVAGLASSGKAVAA